MQVVGVWYTLAANFIEASNPTVYSSIPYTPLSYTHAADYLHYATSSPFIPLGNESVL